MAQRASYACLALGAWLILFTGWAGVSVASPGWSLQTNLVEEPEREHPTPSVAMDGKGDTLVAWNEPVGGYEAIEAAWRPAGGTFEKPIPLSPIGVRAFSPAVAMDSRGDATVAWLWLPLGGFPGEGIIDVATRSAGGTFTAPVQITGSENNEGLDIAMDQAADTTIAWTHFNDAFHLVQGSTRTAEGTFSEAITLSGPADGSSENVSATGPTIAMDSSGDTTVTWSASALSSNYQQIAPFYSQISTKPADGNFSSPADISGSSSVASNASGETALIWQSYDSGTLKLEGAFRPTVHDSFDDPLEILSSNMSESEAAATHSTATLDAAGETTAVIETPSSIATTTRAAGRSFSKPAAIEEGVSGIGGISPQPTLTTDEGGDSTVMWLNYGGDHPGIPVVESASRPAGGKFGPVLRLATGRNSQSPKVAIDGYGDTAAAWISSDGTTEQLHFAGYQATGPRLEAMHAPAEGRAGEVLSFSTAPLSVFSEVASTAWSWGDGSPSSSGVRVNHTFAAPGTYRVSLTATDALGNSTTTTRTLLVTAPVNAEVGRPGGFVDSAPHASAKPSPVSAELVAKPFTPLFATQASTKKQSLGRVVAIAKVRGVADGDTIVVRCLVACARPLRLVRHVGSRHNRRGAFAISPPLVVTRATRIQVEVLAPGRVPRFVDYRFGRSGREVVAHTTAQGCLSSAGAPRPCP
jgi:PKD domain